MIKKLFFLSIWDFFFYNLSNYPWEHIRLFKEYSLSLGYITQQNNHFFFNNIDFIFHSIWSTVQFL